MDDYSFALLSLYEERTSLSLSDIAVITNIDIFAVFDPMKWLVDMKYIEKYDPLDDYPGDGIPLNCPFRITHIGRTALFHERQDRKHFKRKEFREWATLAIAFLALILSVISIVMQLK